MLGVLSSYPIALAQMKLCKIMFAFQHMGSSMEHSWTYPAKILSQRWETNVGFFFLVWKLQLKQNGAAQQTTGAQQTEPAMLLLL